MHSRRPGPMLLAGVTALLLGACATPQPTPEGEKVAVTPRDCEPQTGTRLPASCTKGRGSSSGSVQTMERPTRIESR
ncbi:hypothetical protein [Ideonella sp. YS5]|uniref:hypothetical protein n=1 Tax=Ideonella sp. YS5 TaxID=3453714 RepID=UPI003EE938E8